MRQRVHPTLSLTRTAALIAYAASAVACRSDRSPLDEPQPIGDKLERRVEANPGPLAAGPCSPLQATDLRIRLAPPVAVGRATDGSTWVVDRVGGIDSRSFFAEPGGMELQRFGDEGGSEAGSDFLWEIYEVNGRRLVLRIRRAAWHEGEIAPRDVEMALVAANAGPIQLSESFFGGEALRMLGPNEVQDWAVLNRPQRIVIEYLARTDDGNWLLATRPEPSAYGFEQVRVFFGPPQLMHERRLTAFARQRDGGSTAVRFIVEGAEHTAYFPMWCTSPQTGEIAPLGRECEGRLSHTTVQVPLRQLPPSEGLPSELRFVCGI